MYFHESWVIGILASLGWGIFSALVSMTSFHDAR